MLAHDNQLFYIVFSFSWRRVNNTDIDSLISIIIIPASHFYFKVLYSICCPYDDQIDIFNKGTLFLLKQTIIMKAYIFSNDFRQPHYFQTQFPLWTKELEPTVFGSVLLSGTLPLFIQQIKYQSCLVLRAFIDSEMILAEAEFLKKMSFTVANIEGATHIYSQLMITP